MIEERNIPTNGAIFPLANGQLRYFKNFFDPQKADRLFAQLHKEILWQQDPITVFGKTYMQPRLTALYANNNKPYSYSGITMHPHTFTAPLKEIQQKIEAVTKARFTTVLLNLYRDGNDSNGWHADNEKELGLNPVIASVSFGVPRYFQLKHRSIKEERFKFLLEHGSLLLMEGKMQHHWLHQIAKTKQVVEPRINLTFRKII